MSKPFLTAEWRKLVIANYAVNPAVLKKYIPVKTELDLWNSTCYLSLVGFLFKNTKVKGCKIPFHVNFEEANLRFYVKHFDGKKWNRGVVFIKELVPRRMISLVARKVYSENYHTLRMKHRWKNEQGMLSAEYFMLEEKWHSFGIKALEKSEEIIQGSETEFITEHYWGYTKLKDGKTAAYPVEHPRWKIYPVRAYHVTVDFAMLYGNEFAFLNNTKPRSVILCEGSEVKVMKGKII